MGPDRSSVLRIAGDSSEVSGSRQTGGESNRLAEVVRRVAPGELPSPLGKGKGKINEIRYPEGSEYLRGLYRMSRPWALTELSLYLGKSLQPGIGPRLAFRFGALTC